MQRYKKLILVLIAILSILIILVILSLVKKEEGEEIVIPSPPEETNIIKSSLSSEKEKIRQALIAPLGGEPGTITDGPDYRIDYLPAGEVFQIEIKTTYIARARDEAIAFFRGKGFNEEDICNLPVAFYLGPEPFKELEGSGVVVNPKPDFCP